MDADTTLYHLRGGKDYDMQECMWKIWRTLLYLQFEHIAILFARANGAATKGTRLEENMTIGHI